MAPAAKQKEEQDPEVLLEEGKVDEYKVEIVKYSKQPFRGSVFFIEPQVRSKRKKLEALSTCIHLSTHTASLSFTPGCAAGVRCGRTTRRGCSAGE